MGIFCSHCSTALLGQGLLIVEIIPHSVGLLWTSDRPDTETSAWQKTDIHASGGIRTLQSQQASAPQTHALGRAAAGKFQLPKNYKDWFEPATNTNTALLPHSRHNFYLPLLNLVTKKNLFFGIKTLEGHLPLAPPPPVTPTVAANKNHVRFTDCGLK